MKPATVDGLSERQHHRDAHRGNPVVDGVGTGEVVPHPGKEMGAQPLRDSWLPNGHAPTLGKPRPRNSHLSDDHCGVATRPPGPWRLDQRLRAVQLGHRFGLDGVNYEIDLSEENAATMRDALATWVGHARRVGVANSPARRQRPRSGATWTRSAHGAAPTGTASAIVDASRPTW